MVKYRLKQVVYNHTYTVYDILPSFDYIGAIAIRFKCPEFDITAANSTHPLIKHSAFLTNLKALAVYIFITAFSIGNCIFQLLKAS